MTRIFIIAIIAVVGLSCTRQPEGQKRFDDLFEEASLRFDVSVRPVDDRYDLRIDSAKRMADWCGRRVNLSRYEYCDALTAALIDRESGDTIFATSKYLASVDDPEADSVICSAVFVPQPKADAEISISVWAYGDEGWEIVETVKADVSLPTVSAMAVVDPDDIPPYKVIREPKEPGNSVTIAIVAEGYTADETDDFLVHAAKLDSALFGHEAFAEFADRFKVVAVMLESEESGISRPSHGEVVKSALGAHFDSFNLDRLITIPDPRPLYDALACAPGANVMILANTENYGGSGPTNEYAIASAGNYWWAEIMVHEFGHTFANLGDEYEAGYDIQYPSHLEPDSPNITTMHDFSGKWQNLIDEGKAGLIEGAGYQSKGVWRGSEHCLMRELGDRRFCPVCTQALMRTISYQIEEQNP